MWEAELEMQIDEVCNLDPGSLPTEQDVFDIYAWIDSLDFSRPKRNITRDFSDGVLYAELLGHYLPAIVDTKQFFTALSRKNKQNNWDHLTAKVLPKLGMKVDKSLLRDIMDCRPGSIEKLLYSTRPFIARRNRSVLNYRRNFGAVSVVNVVVPEKKPKAVKAEPKVLKVIDSSGVSVLPKTQPVTQKPAPRVRQRSKPVKVVRTISPKMDGNGNHAVISSKSSPASVIPHSHEKAIRGGGQARKLKPVETEVWNLDDAMSEMKLEKYLPEAALYAGREKGSDEQIQPDSVLPTDFIMYRHDHEAALDTFQQMNTYGLV